MPPARKLIALVTATTLASAMGALPADAATKRFTDTPDDVRIVQIQDDGAPGETRPAVDVPPDIRSLTVRHARRTVAATVRLSELDRPTDEQILQVALDFRGSNGQRRTVAITASGNKRASEMYRASNLRKVCAKSLRTTVRYSESAGQVRATFPRRCLDNPKRVRVGGVIAVGDVAAVVAAGSGEVAYDYAFRNGGEPTVRPTYSPWVRHN